MLVTKKKVIKVKKPLGRRWRPKSQNRATVRLFSSFVAPPKNRGPLEFIRSAFFQPIFSPNDFASKHRPVQVFFRVDEILCSIGENFPSTTPSDFFDQILLGTPMEAPRAPRPKVLPALSICKQHLPPPPDPSIWWCLPPKTDLGGGGGKASSRLREVPFPDQLHDPPAWPRPTVGSLTWKILQSS